MQELLRFLRVRFFFLVILPIIVLSVIIAAIVVASVWALLREVVNRLILGAFDTLDYATFQVVFGMIFTVVIALEFKRSLLVATERSFGILQVRTIVLIALLALIAACAWKGLEGIHEGFSAWTRASLALIAALSLIHISEPTRPY